MLHVPYHIPFSTNGLWENRGLIVVWSVLFAQYGSQTTGNNWWWTSEITFVPVHFDETSFHWMLNCYLAPFSSYSVSRKCDKRRPTTTVASEPPKEIQALIVWNVTWYLEPPGRLGAWRRNEPMYTSISSSFLDGYDWRHVSAKITYVHINT